jgi:hypothetical protein
MITGTKTSEKLREFPGGFNSRILRPLDIKSQVQIEHELRETVAEHGKKLEIR